MTHRPPSRYFCYFESSRDFFQRPILCLIDWYLWKIVFPAFTRANNNAHSLVANPTSALPWKKEASIDSLAHSSTFSSNFLPTCLAVSSSRFFANLHGVARSRRWARRSASRRKLTPSLSCTPHDAIPADRTVADAMTPPTFPLASDPGPAARARRSKFPAPARAVDFGSVGLKHKDPTLRSREGSADSRHILPDTFTDPSEFFPPPFSLFPRVIAAPRNRSPAPPPETSSAAGTEQGQVRTCS